MHGLLPRRCLSLARSLSLSWWRRDKLSSPSLRSGWPSRCETGRRRLLVCTQANGTYATNVTTATYIRLSHTSLSNRLAGAGILGSTDRCLSSLFVLHFKHFCGCLLSKDIYVSSLSLSLCLLLLPPVWDCSEICQFWHMLLPENVSTPAALLDPLITCKKIIINWAGVCSSSWLIDNGFSTIDGTKLGSCRLELNKEYTFFYSAMWISSRGEFTGGSDCQQTMFFIPGWEVSESQCWALSHI